MKCWYYGDSSKMSLFNLFSKPKVERARGHIEVGLAVPMAPPPPPPPPPEQISMALPESPSTTEPEPSSPAQEVRRSRSSQMFRPTSFRTPRTPLNTVDWELPPLDEAYQQSIKHATVQSCVFSPEALLRTQSQRKQLETFRERMDSHGDLSLTLDKGEHRKLEKNHKRLISHTTMSAQSPQLTDKVFVLTEMGYVLQYSGDGAHDRLPERLLRLGKESVAYACDLIPGKHFVLQISRSAKEDGTVAIGPKASLLSRLRRQPTPIKHPAGSFLLILDSAEDMEEWMSAVRNKIDLLNGANDSQDTTPRSSIWSEELVEKRSQEGTAPAVNYSLKRDSNRMSTAGPVDSPHQPEYPESPKITTTASEYGRTDNTAHTADSDSVQPSRYSDQRISSGVPSIPTTAIFREQSQLEQLQDKSRYSYVSTATSASGAGTRDTSPNASLAPTSPKEAFSSADAEPFRSATSLRSFQMNPSTTPTHRRRSMQPLPVTTEDALLSPESIPVSPQRHSFYSPTSPTLGDAEQKTLDSSSASLPVAPAPPEPPASQLAPLLCRPTARNVRYSTQPPLRTGGRSASAPPARYSVISPPLHRPAPAPPASQPRSILQDAGDTSLPRSGRRVAQTPKPFLRPIPVRPQNHHTDGSNVLPRRQSSLGPPLLPLGVVVNRSVTTPVMTPSNCSESSTERSNPERSNPSQQETALRRPINVRIRSDPAPFLSSSRPVPGPVRAISSTPSFIPGKRSSPNSASPQPSTSISALRPPVLPHTVSSVRSMPAMGLPPPAPPPTMPLPAPPPLSPPTVPLPALPAPPPTIPLPAPPGPAPFA
ncbi:hypothetical protein M011DRAFT_194944 [Sporormia fimetaria CBS 119925]|uniref:PH domain-containing protein n=1 Tax=Sporormia fimetaria CBS 119925 TaxID=1340428 RepID=A0A6A6V2K9_9PLEO|nr:hypothetical protein M011DRAFT_194944 [Sporormia fimetaria CBS 119925]